MPGIIQIDDINQSQALIGNNDENLKAIEAHFNVVIHARGQEIAVKAIRVVKHATNQSEKEVLV